jgi:hypothetical protein
LWWGDHCNHCNHSRKHNSNHLSVHQWIRSAIRESQQPALPIGFLFLKLPPPPCAVLLVFTFDCFLQASATYGRNNALYSHCAQGIVIVNINPWGDFWSEDLSVLKNPVSRCWKTNSNITKPGVP